MSYTYVDAPFKVNSANVAYGEDTIEASYTYHSTEVAAGPDGSLEVTPKSRDFSFRTERAVPKLGMMVVGLCGNNGSTVTAGIMANRRGLSWETKEGEVRSNYFGSITQASTVRLGRDEHGSDIYVPFSKLLPMVSPNDLVVGGWDINKTRLGDAMKRAAVLDVDLQRQLYAEMQEIEPLPSIYLPDFIAANQSSRANNVLEGSRQEQMDIVRGNIRDFKAKHGLDKVVVMWSANTERFCEVTSGVHDTADNLLAAIARDVDEVSPSTIFAVASLLEGCSYINGSPQNSLVPGVVELATRQGVFVGGDDFKSGQTKIKSVLVDFLVSSGIKPVSIVSYNHLGNNDGKNLSAPKQFRSKEISKSNVVDDMVASNGILYDTDAGEHPDHTVVIKYVPYVGDSKRAMDEYTSEIFMNGKNTIVMHNTCEDSLLAAPLILDLVILTELCERITVDGERFHPVLSLLSFLLKAPLVPKGTPVVNALFAQRQALVNIFRACVGLAPDSQMLLDNRLKTAGVKAHPC